jgi:hypothetical protein
MELPQLVIFCRNIPGRCFKIEIGVFEQASMAAVRAVLDNPKPSL